MEKEHKALYDLFQAASEAAKDIYWGNHNDFSDKDRELFSDEDYNAAFAAACAELAYDSADEKWYHDIVCKLSDYYGRHLRATFILNIANEPAKPEPKPEAADKPETEKPKDAPFKVGDRVMHNYFKHYIGTVVYVNPDDGYVAVDFDNKVFGTDLEIASLGYKRFHGWWLSSDSWEHLPLEAEKRPEPESKFKVGDRVREKHNHGKKGTVIGLLDGNGIAINLEGRFCVVTRTYNGVDYYEGTGSADDYELIPSEDNHETK